MPTDDEIDAKLGKVFPAGFTLRAVGGDGMNRATYADWLTSRPWLCFVDGVPAVQLATIAEARAYFEKLGRPLETEEARKERLRLLKERLLAENHPGDSDIIERT